MKLVSIIIPTFNEESNIVRLLLSIKSQTYKNVESIVVDDNSTDKTVRIATKYADKVYKRKHAERSIQRNFGALKSRGDYLLFLDADMELGSNVVKECVFKAEENNLKALIIPEKTTGKGFISKIRQFEREMYENDFDVEVARFFDKKVFNEFSGYDSRLTGPEDYDLPYRISKKYKIGRTNEYLFHHESSLSLFKLLRKKFYYANKGAYYAKKHPELLFKQGILIFRKAYLRNWKKFIKKPILGLIFLFIRTLETISAGLGFIAAILFNDEK